MLDCVGIHLKASSERECVQTYIGGGCEQQASPTLGTWQAACFAVSPIENGVLVAIALARDCKEIVLCESSCKSEKNRPSQSSSDFETD